MVKPHSSDSWIRPCSLLGKGLREISASASLLLNFVHSATLVTCYLNENCDCSVREQIPLEMCCSNVALPMGFSYRILGQVECIQCPMG